MPNYKILPMASHHTLPGIEYGKSSSYLILLQPAPEGVRAIGPRLRGAVRFFLLPLGGEREQTRSTSPRAGSAKLSLSLPLQVHLESLWARNVFQAPPGAFFCVIQLYILYRQPRDRLLVQPLLSVGSGGREGNLRWSSSPVRWASRAHQGIPGPTQLKGATRDLHADSSSLSHRCLCTIVDISYIIHLLFIFSCANTHTQIAIYTSGTKLGPYAHILVIYF